jgi:hypothetical protein
MKAIRSLAREHNRIANIRRGAFRGSMQQPWRA